MERSRCFTMKCQLRHVLLPTFAEPASLFFQCCDLSRNHFSDSRELFVEGQMETLGDTCLCPVHKSHHYAPPRTWPPGTPMHSKTPWAYRKNGEKIALPPPPRPIKAALEKVSLRDLTFSGIPGCIPHLHTNK